MGFTAGPWSGSSGNLHGVDLAAGVRQRERLPRISAFRDFLKSQGVFTFTALNQLSGEPKGGGRAEPRRGDTAGQSDGGGFPRSPAPANAQALRRRRATGTRRANRGAVEDETKAEPGGHKEECPRK